MRVFWLAVCALLFTLGQGRVFAQQVQITGNVTDTLLNPLPFANIQLLDAAGNLVGYAVADEYGVFALKISHDGEYIIKVSSLGNFPGEKRVVVASSGSSQINVSFRLKPNPELLGEVVVSKDVGARVRSDTITYNVDKYLTGNEKVLRDVLNKLPGIEVQENGKVKAYGKDVDKILVEGDDFFFDQQKMATENLSAESIGQVQVLNNYQANSLQKDFSQGGQTALNINVKDEYRNKLSGNVSAGGGYNNRYLANTNLYRFGKKAKAGFIGSLNNTGEETFSMHDYMSFGAGIGQLMENTDNAGGLVQVNPGEMSSGISGGSDANRKTTGLGALNVNYKPDERFKLNSSIIVSATNRSEFEKISRSFLGPNSGFVLVNSLDATKELYMGNLNVSSSYKPKADMALSYRSNILMNGVEGKNEIENQGLRSFALTENQNFKTSKLSQYFDFSWKFHPRAFLNVGLFHETSENLINEKLYSDSVLLGLNFPSPFSLSQELVRKKQQYGFNAALSYKFGKVVLKSISGVNNIDQRLNSDMMQDSEGSSSPVEGFDNNLNYEIRNYRSSLYLVKNKGLVQFNAGWVLQLYASSANAGSDLNKWMLSPDIRFTLKFSDTHNLNLNFSQKLALPSPEELLVNSYVKNYRTLASGGLSSGDYSLVNQLNGHYMLFDAFSNTLVSLSAFYSRKATPVSVIAGNGIDFNTQKSAVVPYGEALGSMANFDKKFRKVPLSFRFNTGFNKNTGFNFLQNSLNEISQQNLNFSGGIITRFNFMLNTEIGIASAWSVANSVLAGFRSTFRSFQPFVKLDMYLKSGFSGYVSFSKLEVKSELQHKRYNVLSSTLRYQKPSTKLEFSFSVSNLLNLDSYYSIDTQARENFYQERQYSVLPGYVLFRIKYTLKGMSR